MEDEDILMEDVPEEKTGEISQVTRFRELNACSQEGRRLCMAFTCAHRSCVASYRAL